MRLKMFLRTIPPFLLLTGLLLLQTALFVYAAPSGQSAEEGKTIFDAKCAACHTIGGGDLAGPDLAGVAEKRDPEWLERWLAEPDKMLSEGDPIATELLAQYNNIPMPNLNLSQADIESLLVYMGVDTAHAAPQQAAAPALPPGDAKAGRQLFTGSTRLVNSGGGCIACHDIGGLGTPGGGTIGPDLTKVYTRYGGEAGLAGVLTGLPFPTMLPIYGTRPLTPQEQADLLAFFKKADQSDPPDRTVRHLTTAIMAFAGLDVFFAALVFWRRSMGQTDKLLGRRP